MIGKTTRFRKRSMSRPVLAMVATFAYVAVLLTLRGFLGEGGDMSQALGTMTLLQALLNAVMVPFVFGFLGWLQRTEPERT